MDKCNNGGSWQLSSQKSRLWVLWGINGSFLIPVYCDKYLWQISCLNVLKHKWFSSYSCLWSISIFSQLLSHMFTLLILQNEFGRFKIYRFFCFTERFLENIRIEFKEKNIAFERVILSHNFQKIKVKPEISTFM